jgi:serine/threonine-protein kinase RsbW
METRRLRLIIDSDLRCVSLLGVSVRAICIQERFPEQDTANIELCVVEATNNAIEHAYESKTGKYVEIIVDISDKNIQVLVCDEGKPIPHGLLDILPKSVEFDPLVLDSIPEGGMGIILIKSIMDRISYSTEKMRNIFTMQKNILS